MKKQEIQELKGKSEAELKKILLGTRDELEKIELNFSLKKEGKTSLKKDKKKMIARILTFLSQEKASQKEVKNV